jgi:hypothetical protein
MSSTKSNNKPEHDPNRYRAIDGYINSSNPISTRALLKKTIELLELPANATLLDPSKICTGELLEKTVKFYNGGKTFKISKEDISDCYTVLLQVGDNQSIICAVTFAPFIVDETELIVYIKFIKAKESRNGSTLFNIIKDFVMKCYTDHSEVLLLLSASTALTPHAFFEKQGCKIATDRDLLKLTQKDSTLTCLDIKG